MESIRVGRLDIRYQEDPTSKIISEIESPDIFLKIHSSLILHRKKENGETEEKRGPSSQYRVGWLVFVCLFLANSDILL